MVPAGAAPAARGARVRERRPTHTAAAPQRPFAACDSALFVWQTTAAAEKWPATEAKAAEIRLAFAAPLHRRNRGGGGGDAEQLGKKRGLGGKSTVGKSGSEKKAKKTPEWKARAEKNRGARKEEAALKKVRLNAMRKQRKVFSATGGKR